MKGYIQIVILDEIKKTKYYFDKEILNYQQCDYLIEINIPKNVKPNLLKLKIGFNKYLSRKLKGKQYNKEYPELVEIIKNSFSNNIDLFDNCDVIILDTYNKELLDFFRNKKKIVIEKEEYKITKEDLEKAKSLYSNYSNIYLKIEGNREYISLNDYIKTVNYIYNIVDRINSYNLSPLEAVMYAYDYTRDRVYEKENEEQSPNISRDLTSVLLGDKIVCVGYAEILDKILKGLGITSAVYTIGLNNNKSRHAINVVYLKDDKYNVKGIYYFDPTFDGKATENSNEHLNIYQHFAMLKESLYYYYYKLNDETFGNYNIDYYIENYENIIDKYNQIFPDFKTREKYHYIININNFFEKNKLIDRYIGGIRTKVNKETILKNLKKYKELIYKPIHPKKLFEALLRVRKIEYYENPSKYETSILNIIKIGKKSWEINESKEYAEYLKQINQIKLTKVLSNVKKT